VKRPALVWGSVIVGILLTSVVIQGTALILALADPSFAVEADYEWKARNWDKLRRQAQSSDALGWSFDQQTAPAPTAGEVQVRVTLVDRDGAPVRGAEVEVATFHNARAGQVLTSRLPEVEEGIYGETLPMRRSGVWEFRVEITRGGERFEGKVRKSVLSTPRTRGGAS
jgi:nitrogen fixation protein FixH